MKPLPYCSLQQDEQLLSQKRKRSVKKNLSGNEHPKNDPYSLSAVQVKNFPNHSTDSRRSKDQEVTQDLDSEHDFFQRGIHQAFYCPLVQLNMFSVILEF